jgi:hypothetical protein
MRITFDPGARADLDDIFAWIATPHFAWIATPHPQGQEARRPLDEVIV